MSEECQKCGQAVEQDWAVCPNCATSLKARNCGSCGKKMQPSWKACPTCGWRPGPSEVPDLPDDEEFEKAKGPSSLQKQQAQRLLDQFKQAIADYARDTKPEFGRGFAMLFGAAKVPSPERVFSLRNQIYEAVQDEEVQYAGPFCEMLCSKKKGQETEEVVTIFRNEARYMETELGLVSGSASREQDDVDKFSCPGCGERATAKNSSLCPTCNRYVHNDCAVKGFVKWSCPVCETGLVGQS